MVVMWKENPMPSSFSSRRALSQPSVITLRSDARMASSLRISMMCTPLLCRHDEMSSHDGIDTGFENVEAFGQNGVFNGQGGQNLDDFAVRAAGFDNQPLGKGAFGDLGGNVTGTDID